MLPGCVAADGWHLSRGWVRRGPRSAGPQVREARAAAQAQADELAPDQLASLELRPPPARTLVAYDDL